MVKREEELQAILDIGIALSAERDRNKLFNLIISKSMEITGCDAGTLYLYRDNALHFKIMKTLSLNIDRGSDGEAVDLPPVALKKENICAYSALNREILNIDDVMKNEVFDFSGPKRYDSLTGYHTQSMLVVPLIDDDDEVVGVLQLINAMDENGNVVSFAREYERIVYALGSLTAIAVTNMRYQQELKDQLWSFTEAMAAAIDARTPYNASHTRNVAKYCGLIADYINKLHEEGKEDDYFDAERKEQLEMGAWLHDIGKMAVPLEVMNKATRLNGGEKEIVSRFEKFKLEAEIAFLKGTKSEDDYNETVRKTEEAIDTVKKVNGAGFVDDDLKNTLERVLEYAYDGEPFFTEEEKKCLKVIKGTLTDEERRIMENHVVITAKILDKVHFNRHYEKAPVWASQHHECLNGRGYPNHLNEGELSAESRIMAVADICDALLATDRPYKKPIPLEKAFDIMRGMVKDGNIDGKYVEYLYNCIDRQDTVNG